VRKKLFIDKYLEIMRTKGGAPLPRSSGDGARYGGIAVYANSGRIKPRIAFLTVQRADRASFFSAGISHFCGKKAIFEN
jgi:hypothetical protein